MFTHLLSLLTRGSKEDLEKNAKDVSVDQMPRSKQLKHSFIRILIGRVLCVTQESDRSVLSSCLIRPACSSWRGMTVFLFWNNNNNGYLERLIRTGSKRTCFQNSAHINDDKS